MKSKRFGFVLWIVGLLFAAGFGYYFLTVVTMAGCFQPKVKLTIREKEMIEVFESRCNCEVEFHHNYYLINSSQAQHFTSSDSVISIHFRNDLNKTVLPCSYGKDVLIAHATEVASKMMNTISLKDHYGYLDVSYSSFRGRWKKTFSCSRLVQFKLTTRGLEFISIRDFK